MSEVLVAREAIELDVKARAGRFRGSILVGGVLVALVILVALGSFLRTPHDPEAINLKDRLAGPGSRYLLGTDQYGRDLVSMLMVGARTTLYVGIIAVAIAIVVGVPLGALAAVRRGWTEELVMRASDVIFAFPAVLMAVLLSATFGPSTLVAMAAIGISYVPIFARITRASALQILEREFVLAARAYGLRSYAIFTRHVLHNISYVLIVQGTIAFALAILAEAALSYLGLGTQPPTPSWGRMLRDAQTFLSLAPRLAIWPGLAIALSVLGFNLMGDGLRDILDPKLADRRP